MAVVNDPEKCCYCGGCVGVCPVLALELDETRLRVDNKKCTNCLACIRLCPVGAMEAKPKKQV